GSMFAIFHGIDTHWSVQRPWGTDIDQVCNIAFTQFFPYVVTATEFFSFGKTMLFKDFLALFYHFRIFITQRSNLNTLNVRHSFYCSRATAAKPNKANADSREFWRSITTHIKRLLTLLFNSFNYSISL